ncbi:MAG: SDR family oxidoreductase [Acidobacteria bacterium]|nr:SDR family oxidoreductase [Acidobacteriota bacterium]
MSMMLSDSHVVITGASRGLGRAIARVFHRTGARVSLTSRSEADLKQLADELSAQCIIYPADLRNKNEIAACLNHFRMAHGPVDILINNAGVGAYRPFIECSEEEILETLELNLVGLVMVTRAVVEEMIERRRGQLIHIASDLGRKPLAKMAVYTATKHGVVGFSQSLARELKEYGIKSMVLTPGIIDTYFAGRKEGDLAGPGALTPEAVAEAVLFVASQPPHVLIDELSVHPIGQEF